MHRCIGSDFRYLISLPTLYDLLATVHDRDNVGDPPVMMSSHFRQAKPPATTLNQSVTASSDMVGSIPNSPTLHHE